jgi:hypothetical protein
MPVVILAYPSLYKALMISILMTPCFKTGEFQTQYETISKTIGCEFEVLCTLINGDPERDWFEAYFKANNIRYLKVPDLGYTTLINILAARALGDVMLYIAPTTIIDETEQDWGLKIVAALSDKDRICGAILSLTHNDLHCSGLAIPQRTFVTLGYYCHPLFETQVYGVRWNASVLTEFKRLYNITCGFTYQNVSDTDMYKADRLLFDITRAARITVASRLEQFMEVT